MDRCQTIALFVQGRDAWNAWANERLAERKVLEEKGRWLPKRDWFDHNKLKYEEARQWMESAAADFSGCRFLGSNEKAREENKESESAGQLGSIDPLEPRPAHFDAFIFPGKVQFDNATFYGDASFQGAIFEGDAWFKEAKFKGDAWFKSANFNGGAVFDRATFEGDAWFRSAAFTGHAWFDSVRFHRVASFYSVKAKHGFALLGASFKRRVPDFISSKFEEPILLDNIRLETGVEPGGFVRSVFGGLLLWLFGNPDHALSAKYRALRQFAVLGDDHRNEQIFFSGELRTWRYTSDKPWNLRFWYSVIYELTSNFGLSTLRPFLWLMMLSLLSSWFYLDQHVPPNVSARAYIEAQFLSYLPDRVHALIPALRPGVLPPLSCKDNSPGDPVAAALRLNKTSSVLAAFESANNSTHNYACLYGYDEKMKMPLVPYAVVAWAGAQTVGSSVLLFLFLLALRNYFKIK
jgi:Pentapeptide repeats (9 copies)